MSPQALTPAAIRKGQAHRLCKQTKLQIACKKVFGASKHRFSGIKTGHNPIKTGVTSYQIKSKFTFVNISRCGQAASVSYLTNPLGQRVFKSEPTTRRQEPSPDQLGTDYVAWLKKNFAWLFNQQNSNSSLGTAYVYGDAELGQHSLLGEYGNGAAKGKGRTEYIWLPTEDGNSIPVGMYRNGKFFAIHPDHLGTPRLVSDEDNQPVWQWPYSAFGDNKPTGILTATTSATSAYTQDPASLTRLQATTPALVYNPRYPGQYHDEESNLSYNYFRNYQPNLGRYTQNDPIGLEGGINRFGYVEGNPLSKIDPTGLKATSPNMSPAPDTDTKLCFDDGCARERQACTALCTRARFDSDMPNVFGGSFRACMRGCVPARCGGN